MRKAILRLGGMVRRRAAILAALCVLILVLFLSGGGYDAGEQKIPWLIKIVVPDTFPEPLVGTPYPYRDHAGQYLRVTAEEDSMEFVAVAPGSGAPADAKYIVQEANAGLSDEQSLGALTTGLLKNTVTASVGVLSAATEGTDYLSKAKDGRTHARETFDGLSTAAVHGQGSYIDLSAWSSTLPATSTVSVAVKSGADKMLTCTSVAGEALYGSDCTFSNRWGFGAGGRISFKMQTSNTVKGESGLRVMAGSTVKTQIYFRNTGKITYWNGSTVTDLQASSNATWYQVDLFIDALYCTIFIDGVYKNRLTTGAAALWDKVGVYGSPDAAVATTTDYDDLLIVNAFGLD